MTLRLAPRLLPTLLAAALLAGCGNTPTARKAAAEPAEPAGPKAPESFEEKASWAIGYRFGASVREQGLPLVHAQVQAGLESGLAGNPSRISPQELQQIMMQLQQKAMAEKQRQMQARGQAAEARGKAFLAENATREEVEVTDSGLQYEVLTAGEGDRPKPTDQVTVHYRGTLLDGTEFDSSYERGEPTSFRLNQVIPGWTEGVQLMSPGAKYKFYIPSGLAYGPRGAGQAIGPNETLTFEVELLKVGSEDGGDGESGNGDGSKPGDAGESGSGDAG